MTIQDYWLVRVYLPTGEYPYLEEFLLAIDGMIRQVKSWANQQEHPSLPGEKKWACLGCLEQLGTFEF